VQDFFSEHGTYGYLSELLEPGEAGSYKLQPHDVAGTVKPELAFRSIDLTVYAVRVVHGGVPALAWRIELGGKVMVFSGDTNGEGGLVELAKGADLLVAHNAVPEGATGVERRLHMPPSVIGQIAAGTHVKRLVLSHRMLRTLGKEEATRAEIRKKFNGPMEFANDLDCFALN
jgi:ribonuclease BN (tRNA processing enzyme)